MIVAVVLSITNTYTYKHFHSIMNYGLIFWGNSSHSVKIFKIQKNIISIIEAVTVNM
jgi:hypothetical protein